MALGKSKKFNSATNVYSVNYRNKDKVTGKSTFQVKKKVDGAFQRLEDVTDISGTLLGVKHKVTPWQGKTIESIDLTLLDNEDIYFVSFPLSISTRSLFNAMFNLKTFENLEIGTYMSKPKVQGGNSYAQICLRQNGEMIRWKYALDQIPKADEIVFKGQKMRDYTKTDAFFLGQLAELQKVIESRPTSNKAEVPDVELPTTEPEVEAPGKDEDVPF